MSEFGTNDVDNMQEGIFEQTKMIKEHIEGNIEILDYLQGISGLERDFSKLAERVINAAVTLSDRDNVAHPERIYDKETGVSVDRCWTYISQLSEAIQFHITKSHEYHKFHHEIWAARMEIQQLLSSYSLIQEKLGH
uniref:SJCHGC02581 protein n=1 Tax=Schistosoma japonicum TaxID=6182 RepID=Q5DA87_SCHJA|nr:SJCHGC02581 protein [Schistosoma japonicum]